MRNVTWRGRSRNAVWVLSALIVFASLSLNAQVTDATALGGPVELTDNWRFHAGDDLRWKASDFDDSSWKLISANKSWAEQGIDRVRGYVWLRTRVELPDPMERLAVFLQQVGPYEMFVDGKRVGGYGQFPPAGLLYEEKSSYYDLPVVQGHFPVIAMRFWIWPQLDHIRGFPGRVFLGSAPVIGEMRDLAVSSLIESQIPAYILETLYLVLAGGLIILFALQRDHSEYIWLAGAIFFAVIKGIVENDAGLAGMDAQVYSYLGVVTGVISAVCLLEFVFRFLGERMPLWARVYQIAFGLMIVRVFGALHGWISLSDSNLMAMLFELPYWFVTPAVVLWRYIKGNKEAGLLAIPLLLMFLTDMLGALRWVLWHFGIRQSQTAIVPDWHVGVVDIGPDFIAHFLFFLSIGALILYRFQKTRTEQARAKAELEAARSMQEVMVPATTTAAGFHIETAYLPAQEVGGDFFQIFPAEDGSLLVVIGDVSGKGLKAAMLVSLILGMLRRIVSQIRTPGRILTELNELLVGQTDGRFATCCCALLHPGGRMAIANAGHLSPYCGGIEVETPGGIPLGVAPAVQYDQVNFQVPPGQRVLFLSDGVVEARNKTGELYGFERTRTISIQPASQIAETAQQFGQEDDITVVGIRPEPAFA